MAGSESSRGEGKPSQQTVGTGLCGKTARWAKTSRVSGNELLLETRGPGCGRLQEHWAASLRGLGVWGGQCEVTQRRSRDSWNAGPGEGRPASTSRLTLAFSESQS